VRGAGEEGHGFGPDGKWPGRIARVVEGSPVGARRALSIGAITSYRWKQVAGPQISAPVSATSAIAFAAPRLVPGLSLELLFELNGICGRGEATTGPGVGRVVVDSDGRIEVDTRCNSDADGDRIVNCNDKCVADAFKGCAGRLWLR